jgi:filamentous hemagglutinin family protein
MWRRRAIAWFLAAALTLGPPGIALAGPEGENVVSGGADFVRDGDLTLITTHTQQTVVEYSSFDIGVLETVQIDQPDAASRILNQVLSTDPTLVEGRLFSNGQVWIVNPVGVFFGGQAIVDVGGLVAAAGQVDQQEFLDGIERFEDLSGPVEVGGGAILRAADQVLLAGESVANYGHISATDGMIALVAGGGARLARIDGHVIVSVDPATAPDPERYGVVQAGTLDAGRGEVHLTAGDAYSLAMNHSGITRAAEIHAEGGDDGLVLVAGVLDASNDAEDGRGGRISVLGDLVALDGATLDASGEAGGGEIRVGGEAHGEGETRTAYRTYVSSDSELRADAGSVGDGGRIIVWSDDATAFYGALSARGGSEAGDGGFAEISGARSLVSRGSVDLGAAAGDVGTLLYDPARILITGGTADGTDTDGTDPPELFLRGDGGAAGTIATTDVGDGAEPFVIFESEIEETDANIVLQASQSIETTGEFAGDDVVIQPGRDLTLEVVDAGEAIGPGEIVGVDVDTDGSGDLLTFRLSEGGTLRITAESSEGRSADIAVGNIETSGVRDGTANNVAIIAGGSGDITVASIDTSGADLGSGATTVNSVDGGNVTLLTESGNVAVGLIEVKGGDASAAEPGDGGDGGRVVLGALEGAITVGSIDVSGGDGHAGAVDDGAGGTTRVGLGGDAGSIELAADLDPADPDAELPGGDLRVVTVDGSVALSENDPDTGDPRFGLFAIGGDGLGTDTDADGDFGANGGSGGQIFVSAGHVAEEGAIVLGSAAQAVRLDASGGDGTANGGSTASGNASAFTGAEIGAIRIESHGADLAGDADGDGATDDIDGIVAWADLVATGGRAGAADLVDPGDPVAPGGLGGRGGDVSLASVAGDTTLFDTGGAGVLLDGGEGRSVDILTLGGAGGDAGRFTIEVAGDGANISVLSGIRARGGAGNQGNGGDGGIVTLTALDGSATLFDVDTSGAAGTGEIAGDEDEGIDPAGALGGVGGDVQVTTQAGIADTSVGGGDVLLGGTIRTLGGAGVPDPDTDGVDPNENHGTSGTVRLTSAQDIDAAPGAGTLGIVSGAIEILGQALFTSGGPDLRLSSSGDSGPASFVDTATVQAEGDARVLLDDLGDDANRFERLELIQTEASADFDALRGDASTVIVRATGAGDVHTIQEITTEDADPHLTYRLIDTLESDDGLAEQIDLTTLAVATGAVSLGTAGGRIANARANAVFTEGEALTGRIQGVGAGPHITTRGNLELFATNIGDETPLVVAGVGGAPSLELGVGGDVDVDVTGSIGIVDVNQRRTAGNLNIDFDGGGGVVIVGDVVDDGSSRVESSRIERIDTTGGDISFFFHLSDTTASSDVVAEGEPVLSITSGAVTLGGAAAGIATTGDLVLEADGIAPAIDAGGSTVLLIADSNLDGTGAIEANGTDTHIVDAGGLVALAGEGVGSAAEPLRTSASGAELPLAGSGGSGDFQLVNVSGALVIERIPADDPMTAEVESILVANGGEIEPVTYRGLYAGGDVALDNGGRVIEFGEVQPDLDDEVVQIVTDAPSLGLTGSDEGSELRFGFGDLRISFARLRTEVSSTTRPHVESGGDQHYIGTSWLANPRTFTTIDPDTEEESDPTDVHQVRLLAGGDVVFEGDVDTAPDLLVLPDPDPGSLEVRAHTTTFTGDVGSEVVPAGPGDDGLAGIDALEVNDVLLSAGDHTFTLARGDFRRIEGPGSLALRGLGEDSEIRFRGDVGAGQSLAGFDADADLLVFDRLVGNDGTEQMRADRIVADSVSLNTATPSAAVPEAATIADTGGGLTIESGGDVTIGVREKLTSNGHLDIRAAGVATLSDLTAIDLRVDASRIVIQGREPGAVALPGGGVVQDYGVDWVANDIETNVTPEWDGQGSAPIFVLGSGGIRIAGGGSPLPFDVVRLTGGNDEIGVRNLLDGDRVLDLNGLGPRVVSDPSDDLPRPVPTVAPSLDARFSGTQPVREKPVTGEDVLATVRCRTSGGGPCLPDASGDDVLASERVREIVERYRALVSSPQGRQDLVAAFRPVSGLAPGVDGGLLYQVLASRRDLAPARQRVDELAVVIAQITLLGLDEAGAERVRSAIVRDFADATGLDGLEPSALREAIAASGVGALP